MKPQIAEQVVANIVAMGEQVAIDARNCAREYDLAGLTFIINMATRGSGWGMLRFSFVADVASLLRMETQFVIAKPL